MTERGQDRRREQLPFYEAIVDRREVDRRACSMPLTWSESQPGTIRPGVGEVAPARERRRVPGAGPD